MQKTKWLLGLILIIILSVSSAYAGVFDLPNFLPEGQFSVGVEPEVITSSPSGLGVNLKPKFGASNILNWEAIVGTGPETRAFRLGVTADFDWFPDVGSQPGIATPVTVLYYRSFDSGVLSYGISPLVYKTFQGAGTDYTPFISLPFGWNFKSGTNSAFTQIAMGSMFKPQGSEHFKFTLEAGFDINKSFSYISGGVIWLP